MKTAIGRGRRPFWLPASNYYVLAFALSVAFFFLVWGTLHDGGDEIPWVAAGIGASVILIASVILREFVLRRASMRFTAQRSLTASIPHNHSADPRNPNKLTLEH